MTAIKNVAVTGAAGDLGTPVLNAIVNSRRFNVTVLVRSASKAAFPSSVKIVEVDFTSVSSLTDALKGQDALVSTVGTSGLQGQTLLIDACVAAGVSRFLPSEFGSDLDSKKVKALPSFSYKVVVNKHAKEAVRRNPNFSYTNVCNDYESSKPRIYDSGDQLFSTTTLASVGKAVVGVLLHPEETKNRAVRVHDMSISQNRILAIARKLAPNKNYEPYHDNTDEMFQNANDKIAKGDYSLPVAFTD
ncbi:hypothetical protein OIDMADRAFT_45857 [Oidiodendron maius Zn]|uniref:NAD(P)-binding domain-containing protein n=1 Tax=Oidiodendron maius (strain Zn) TaxID=913774 RepID=A0A0C3GRR8_OIDMZ|nr:hypothetical protein OIDMADRAFT_45857 [Oidiodendron maius Zn]